MPLPAPQPARSRRTRVILLLALAVVLAGAWAHTERGRLLRLPAGQAVLGPVYSLIGLDASPDWSPADLRVLRSATIASPEEPGRLRVTVEFRNAATFGQPHPVLRVTLEDRWGQQLSSRDFAPAEYLETRVTGRLMRPGERVQAMVSLPDPGEQADGFRVDLCLEVPGSGLACSSEARP